MESYEDMALYFAWSYSVTLNSQCELIISFVAKYFGFISLYLNCGSSFSLSVLASACMFVHVARVAQILVGILCVPFTILQFLSL